KMKPQTRANSISIRIFVANNHDFFWGSQKLFNNLRSFFIHKARRYEKPPNPQRGNFLVSIIFKFQIPNSKFQIPNSKFQIPNSKFQIPNSKFQIPNSKFQIPNPKPQT